MIERPGEQEERIDEDDDEEIIVVVWVTTVISEDEDEKGPAVVTVTVVIPESDGENERGMELWLGGLWLPWEVNEDDWGVEFGFDVIEGPGEDLLLDI